MKITAKLKHLRISPRKVRLVVDLIRGLEVNDALDQLSLVNKRAAEPVAKLLRSAIANAEHNFEIKQDNLKIKEIRVDEGRTLKRWLPRAQGRATPLRKRASHISLALSEIVESANVKKIKQKIDEPIKLSGMRKANEGVKIASKIESKRPEIEEKGKKIIDSREEGHDRHAKIEGKSHHKFGGKIFRRKSG